MCSSIAARPAWARLWVERPITTSGPRMRRAYHGGRSPWPRCSTSAPAASARSARSFTATGAPCLRAAAFSSASAPSSALAASGPNFCSPGDPLSRSWMMSTPPASAASANLARSPFSRRASVHRYNRAEARRSRGGSGRFGWEGCTPSTVAALPWVCEHEEEPMPTLAVVGGGAIGLAAAWRAAEAGWSVTLFDPAPASGASWVAGGMLAPLSEGWPGEDAVLEFGAAALAHWPAFAARLEAATGTDVYVAEQTLTVALDAADAADLRTIADWVGGHGHDLRIL